MSLEGYKLRSQSA